MYLRGMNTKSVVHILAKNLTPGEHTYRGSRVLRVSAPYSVRGSLKVTVTYAEEGLFGASTKTDYPMALDMVVQ